MANPAWKTASEVAEGYLTLNSVMLRKYEPHDLSSLQAELEKASRELRGTVVPADDVDGNQKKNRKLLRLSQALTILQAARTRR